MNYCDQICAALRMEADQLFREKETRRAIALKKSAKILENLKRITCLADVKGLGGIGAGTQRRVQAVIDGTSEFMKSGAASETVTDSEESCTESESESESESEEEELPEELPELMLAESWNKLQIDPTGWWMSIKLDGIRCYWDGSKFWTRNKNEIAAPKSVLRQMPRGVKLDGELYCGRKMFEHCMGIKSDSKHPMWKQARFYVFDIVGMNKPFEERVERIAEVCEGVDFAIAVKQKLCKGEAHLQKKMKSEVAKGGEGIMLRKPKSKYEHRRTKVLLKCKPEYDAEAEVVGHVDGKDSLLMRMECGQEFKLSTKFQSKDKFPIGTIITYKFNEMFKSGKPRFPVMMRVRTDMKKPKDFVM